MILLEYLLNLASKLRNAVEQSTVLARLNRAYDSSLYARCRERPLPRIARDAGGRRPDCGGGRGGRMPDVVLLYVQERDEKQEQDTR